ncbi:hypothetical protein ACLB2K_060147 [Fragaria x ananassa]
MMSTLVSPTHVSFNHGRNITDNIIVAQEMLLKFCNSEGNLGFMAWKIALVKAYDKLQWQFIESVSWEVGIWGDIRSGDDTTIWKLSHNGWCSQKLMVAQSRMVLAEADGGLSSSRPAITKVTGMFRSFMPSETTPRPMLPTRSGPAHSTNGRDGNPKVASAVLTVGCWCLLVYGLEMLFYAQPTTSPPKFPFKTHLE